MNVIDSGVMELLREQEKFEDEVTKRLSSLMDRVSNNVVKLLLHTLVLDSMKHASIIRALLDLVQGTSLSESDKHLLREELSRHISEEEEMLGKAKELTEKVKDKNLKAVLEQISLEEERHHKGLRQLLSVLDRVESIGDEEWWEFMNEWANFST